MESFPVLREEFDADGFVIARNYLNSSGVAALTGVTLMVGAFRIGNIGLVGLPCEPFLGIERQIREGGIFPLTIPVEYANDHIGCVPDGPNVDDKDYSSSYYRHIASFLPYRKPGGDLLACGGFRMLQELLSRVHYD